MLNRDGYVSQPVRRSPLAHRSSISSESGDISLAEIPFAGKLIVRGHAPQIGPAIETSMGLALPVVPCTSASNDDHAALWLGPSEWMLITPEAGEQNVLASLSTELGSLHHQLTDLTDYYTIIRVSGRHVGDILAKLTTLDLHPRSFQENAVKGSIFGRVPATLRRLSDENPYTVRFDLVIRWSHADYLWCLLALAGREFGLPEQMPVGRVKLAEPS